MALIGRETELARLSSSLQWAAEGRISRVLISGPLGVGVSRLLDELVLRLEHLPDVAIARGRCHEPLAGSPYHPLLTALEGALSNLSDQQLVAVVGDAGHDLAAVMPHMSQRLARAGALLEAPPVTAPDQQASRFAEGAIAILDRLADGGVTLLILEDLHWADPGTRAFVEALLRISHRRSLCLVLTVAPDELHRKHPARELADALAAHPGAEKLAVPLLERAQVLELLGRMHPERPSGAFLAAVMEGSGGNALLAEHLDAAHEAVSGLRLSESFEEIMHARLGASSPRAVRWLRVLAIARRPLKASTLHDLALPAGHLDPLGLDEAVATGLAAVFPRQAGPDHGPDAEAAPPMIGAREDVGIVHDLYAEAIEALAPGIERQQIHAALAGTMPDHAEQAWHLEAAGDLPGARAAHLAAAEHAEAVEPGGTALYHYDRAIELRELLGGEGSAEEVDAHLLSRAAQAAFVSGSFRRASSLAEAAISRGSSRAAIAAASARNDPESRQVLLQAGSLYERLGRYRWASGDLQPALAAFDHALQTLPAEPTRERARALGAYAQHLMLDGRFEESARLAGEAVTAARALGDEGAAELGHAICTLGVDRAYSGHLEAGLRLLEDATAISRRAGRLDDLMRTYANRTTLLDLDSRREEALAVVNEGIAEARRWGLEAVYGAFLRGNAADCLFTLGRWRESEAECRAALEWSPSGVAFFNPQLYLGLLLVESRADEEATRLVGQIMLQLETVPEGQWTAIVQRAAVSLALWRGEFGDAFSVAGRGWERVLQTDDWAQAAMAASTTLEAAAASAEHARHRRDFAAVAAATSLGREVIAEAERRVAASGAMPTLGGRREAELHLAAARAHFGRLRGHGDPIAWRKVALGWAAIPVPYQAAKAHWWEALATLKAREDRLRARRALVEAWTIATQLGARPLQAALTDVAGRARILLPESSQEEPTAFAIRDQEPATPRRLVPVGPGRPTSPQGAGRAILERLQAPEPSDPGHPFGLSPREAEVLGVLAEGRTNREIAERLFISERTVAVHVRRILAKLAVSSRVGATSLALRLGLVTGTIASPDLIASTRRSAREAAD